MNWAKGLRLSQTNTWFKTKVRTEASNPCSLSLKNCDKRYIVNGNPWGKPRRHTKIKEHAAKSLIAPDSKHSIAGKHQGSSGKSPFHNERPFVVRGPLPSIILNGVGHIFQHKVSLMELTQAYLLVECIFHSLLIQAPMTHGCQALTFNKVELVIACLSPLWFF